MAAMATYAEPTNPRQSDRIRAKAVETLSVFEGSPLPKGQGLDAFLIEFARFIMDPVLITSDTVQQGMLWERRVQVYGHPRPIRLSLYSTLVFVREVVTVFNRSQPSDNWVNHTSAVAFPNFHAFVTTTRVRSNQLEVIAEQQKEDARWGRQLCKQLRANANRSFPTCE